MKTLTKSRKPKYPANFKPRMLAATQQKMFSGCLQDTNVWACGFLTLFKSTDHGLNFTAGYNYNTPYGWNSSESIWCNSAGLMFLTSDTVSVVATSSGNLGKMVVSTNTACTAFTDVYCNDGTTAFHFPAPQTNGQAGHFWNGIWEIEDARELLKPDGTPNGLKLNDIIIAQYHRNPGTYAGAFIYVMRKHDNGKWLLNADPSTFKPGIFGIFGEEQVGDPDPFAAWHTSTQITYVRHIHAIQMGYDGYLYFSCGDFYDSSHAWATGDTDNNYYRFNRIIPNGPTGGIGVGWQCLTPNDGLKGYTSIYRTDDGRLICGNDAATKGTGTLMPIDTYKNGVKIYTNYIPVDPDVDMPIWDIVECKKTGEIFACGQKDYANNPNLTYPYGKSCLIKSTDNSGRLMERVFTSASSPNAGGLWMDIDRIFHDRKRQVPASYNRMIMSMQIVWTAPSNVFYMDYRFDTWEF